ncbi:ROK family protein [Changchengzhania lutea]|uniref:ROK family protein n=1 Tax=Changchengzhania lutea TaxID=2049305 RepID=UPI00115C5664|nr:ROK family protein [Changchengzhania lutea]
MDRELLGVDIGGTNFKIGRVKKSTIEEEICVGVDIGLNEEETINKLIKIIDSVITTDTQGIGVGVPGVVDSLTGIVYDVQNIPAWKEIALKKILHQRYKIPVFINNDANCFALGEKIFGKGKNYENFIGLSIGTGLGMGIIINNRLYNGMLCGAGEIGMLHYKDSIIEQYASSFFFSNNYGISAKDLGEIAKKGDVLGLNAFVEFGLHLGEAIKNILYMFAPEAIILGGSISKAYPYFKQSVEISLKSFAYQKQIENLKIETSNQPGLAILGAAALCLQELNYPL